MSLSQSIDANQALAWSSPHKWSHLSVWMRVPVQPDWLHTPGTDRRHPLTGPPPVAQNNSFNQVLCYFWVSTPNCLCCALLNVQNQRGNVKICGPYRLFQRWVGCEFPSTWWFRCVSCPHSTPWCRSLQREEASSRSGALSGRHSSAMRCRMEQREGLSKCKMIFTVALNWGKPKYKRQENWLRAAVTVIGADSWDSSLRPSSLIAWTRNT